ncbi:hypothetical protein J3458_002187 [Metarhizium acridum]|uniref:uncharacterized protein n=1 Tax=Metarhizium acridum TaxID=92637 RepID=UPI001C6C8493|nr:hypothetical protein J3458_002187 [Metarhizium acridum]
MAGIRNFGDPNVQVNDGTLVWRDDWKEATQCMGRVTNTWEAMHGAYNNGRGDGWFIYDTDYSMGYYRPEYVPIHWDIAEGWTDMDNSHQSVLGLADPNRVMWMSGTVNTAGSKTNPDGQGGNILSNSASPGCDSPGNNCLPFVWNIMPECLKDAGISWQVQRGLDSFKDNMLAYFKQYQDVSEGEAL